MFENPFVTEIRVFGCVGPSSRQQIPVSRRQQFEHLVQQVMEVCQDQCDLLLQPLLEQVREVAAAVLLHTSTTPKEPRLGHQVLASKFPPQV